MARSVPRRRRHRTRVDRVAAHREPAAGARRCCASDDADEGDPITQAEIARLTGLAPATVSNIVRELAAAGLVDTDPGSGRRGRGRLSASAGIVAGIDFGHSHVAVAVGDLTGRVLAEERVSRRAPGPRRTALGLAASILDRTRSPGAGPLRHVGLGLPAPVVNNVVESSAIFPGWEGVDARAAAEAVLRRAGRRSRTTPTSARSPSTGRAHGRGHSSLVFVKISSGVGAGIIIDNRLFHGADGTAGEIGHLTLDEQGPMCRCGSRGCLETYTSSEHMLRMRRPDAPRGDVRRTSWRRPRPATSSAQRVARGRRPAPRLGAGERRQPAQPRHRHRRR